MANISTGNGTMMLEGNWTQEAVEALKPVAQAWEFYGEFGVQDAERISKDPKTGKYTADIYIVGRWTCGNTIESLDEWTRNWINDKKNNSRHPLSTEQYGLLLRIMKENNLNIIFTYVTFDEGSDDETYYKEWYTVESTGNQLCAQESGYQFDVTWEEAGEERTFKDLVTLFRLFVRDISVSAVEDFVRYLPAHRANVRIYISQQEMETLLEKLDQLDDTANIIKLENPYNTAFEKLRKTVEANQYELEDWAAPLYETFESNDVVLERVELLLQKIEKQV